MTASKLEQLEQLLKLKKSKAFYANKLGISELEVGKLMRKLRGKDEAKTDVYAFDEDISNGTAELTRVVSEEIRTLDDLIRVCQIDTGVWDITRYVQNFWGNADSPRWQVKAWLSKKTVDNDPEKQKELIIKTLKDSVSEIIPRKQKFHPRTISSKELLYEISIPDLHIGKLGWSPESGQDYDIDIAVKRYRDAVEELLSRTNLKNIKLFHLPMGNDAIHIDNHDNKTVHGTTVDADGRFPKILRAAKDCFINTINELKKIAPVDVTIVRGNHDFQTMFMLGEIIDAWYHTDDDVIVNSSPRLRKYYQFGENGFQYTHGDQEKHEELGQLFAHEEPLLWANTKYRFCKLGHLHKNNKKRKPSFKSEVEANTFIGFQTQILPSLSGPDEWHYGKGYLSLKQAKGFLYHMEKGEVGEFTTTVL